jgi:cobalt-zinc-cadmium resistance protein CzcA
MNSIIRLSLRNRMLIIGFLVALLAAGGIAFSQLNIEAYPDPVPPMVEIVTQTSGLSAEEMERNVTIPIEVQMAGIPHLNTIRAISLFGLSDVKIQFTYDYTFRGSPAAGDQPPVADGHAAGRAQPGISPTSPIGEIYRYRIAAPRAIR